MKKRENWLGGFLRDRTQFPKVIPRYSWGGTARYRGAKNPTLPEDLTGKLIAGRPDYDVIHPDEYPDWLLNADTENATIQRHGDRIVWLGGAFHDGLWWKGVWLGGRWRDGIWYGGVWKTGIWSTGEWYGGHFMDGTWLDGTFFGGHFSGIWKGGLFMGGEFDGVWLGGVWLGGKFNGLKERTVVPPSILEGT